MIITSIDFETANPLRTSICAAGMAVFENGILTESPYWLVRPPQGHGWFHDRFIECHGLTHLDVQGAPEFPDIASAFLDRLTRSDIVIAHNASFDIGHLRTTLDHFGLICPDFDYLCTLKLARRVWPDLANHKLSTVAAHIGHAFQHHQAKADAEAAGRVMLAMMNQVNATTLEELLQKTDVVSECF
ncbi:3'-5' exonuclease [soil metagenome]